VPRISRRDECRVQCAFGSTAALEHGLTLGPPTPTSPARGVRAIVKGVTDVRNPADSLPGADLVEKGLADLAAGAESAEALLVSAGAPRLRALGLPIASPLEDAEHRLYELLARDDPDAAHSRYNALIRRLVSYERAAECAA